jgi:hypothetical protein
MRNLLNIFEDPQLKKEIIGVVKATDDLTTLQRVLNVLKAGDIDDRIKRVVGQDADAQRFIKKIVTTILAIEAPIEEKNLFLDKYAKGKVINTSALLDGKLHSFEELVGPGFTQELFKRLSIDLVSQGVGPGEVALAVLSPEIEWSGRSQGGGDILVKTKPIEVKTRASKGGRWINARKAKLDLGAIVTAISKAIPKASEVTIPDRINTKYWTDTIRPAIDPTMLKDVAEKIANATFKFTNNKAYQKALINGDADMIVNTYLETGYNNYKKYSGFVGMLLMDIPTEQAQYFVEYADMQGSIGVATTYIYAPESEMMPQVTLSPGAGDLRAGRFVPDTASLTGLKNKKDIEKKSTVFAKKLAAARGVRDPSVINKMIELTMQYVMDNVPVDKIVAKLTKLIPALNPRAKTPAPAPQVQQPVAEPEIEEPEIAQQPKAAPKAIQPPRQRR